MQNWRPAKRLQYRWFPVKIAKNILQNSSGGCFWKIMNSTKIFVIFFSQRWRHMRRKSTLEISSIFWNVLAWIFLNLCYNFFIPLRQAVAITWERFLPAIWDPDNIMMNPWSIIPDPSLPILAKRDRILFPPTGII